MRRLSLLLSLTQSSGQPCPRSSLESSLIRPTTGKSFRYGHRQPAGIHGFSESPQESYGMKRLFKDADTFLHVNADTPESRHRRRGEIVNFARFGLRELDNVIWRRTAGYRPASLVKSLYLNFSRPLPEWWFRSLAAWLTSVRRIESRGQVPACVLRAIDVLPSQNIRSLKLRIGPDSMYNPRFAQGNG